jgi:hypothetical protein
MLNKDDGATEVLSAADAASSNPPINLTEKRVRFLGFENILSVFRQVIGIPFCYKGLRNGDFLKEFENF